MDTEVYHVDEARVAGSQDTLGDGVRGEEQPEGPREESRDGDRQREAERLLAGPGDDVVLLDAAGEHVVLQDAPRQDHRERPHRAGGDDDAELRRQRRRVGGGQPGFGGDGEGAGEDDQQLPRDVRHMEGEGGGGGIHPGPHERAAAVPHPGALHPPHPSRRHGQDHGAGCVRGVQAPHGEVRPLPLL